MEKMIIEKLSFFYEDTVRCSLQDISFDVDSGDFLLITGESGSGKTTLLKQLKPSITPKGTRTGSVKCTSYDNLDDLCGYIFQNPNEQIVTEYVWHELSFALESKGEKSEEIRNKTDKIASTLGIYDLIDKKTNELSGGQKQLVSLASVLVAEPKVLLLDEPISMLDPTAQKKFLDIIYNLNRKKGITVIVSSHNVEQFLQYCSKILVLGDGKTVAFGRPKEVLTELYKNRNSIFMSFPTCCVSTAVITDGKSFSCSNEEAGKVLSVFQSHRVIDNADEFESKIVCRFENISYKYDSADRAAIENVSFLIRSGEITAILGKNGSGKTTALGVIAGFFEPQNGTVHFEKELRCFYIPQDPKMLFRKDSVNEELAYYSNDKVKISKLMEKFSLTKLSEMHPFDLSGGEKQRLAAAIASLCDFDILLLDEPTKGLDHNSKAVLCEILLSIKNEGKTVVLATHDFDFCADTAKYCYVIDNKKIYDGFVRELFLEDDLYTTSASVISKSIDHNAISKKELIASYSKKTDEFSGEDDSSHNRNKAQKPQETLCTVNKRVDILTLLLMLVLPLTAYVCLNYMPERKYFVLCVLVVLEITAYFFIRFERSEPSADKIVLIAVMSAAAVAGRIALFAFPNFKPVLFIVIVTGLSMGPVCGFICGTVSMLVSNFMFGQGSWTIFQMFASGIIGFIAGNMKIDTSKKKNRILIAVFGFISAIVIYGGIVNPSYVLVFQSEITKEMIIASYISGIPFDVSHGAATAILLYAGSDAVIKKIKRAKIKYNI